jgi:MFS family permease
LLRVPQSDAAAELWTLRAAMRHHAFWALFGIFFFTAVGMFAISVQVVTYLIEVGFPPLQAATAWGFSGVLLLVGMLTVSWLDGLLGRRRAILASYSLTVAGIVMLWALSRHPNLWLLGGFLICFGSTMGSRGPLITAAAMTIFRGRSVGTIVGTISIGAGLGSAIGSWSGGLIHDLAQSYDPVFAFALCSVLLGMTPFLVAPALRG